VVSLLSRESATASAPDDNLGFYPALGGGVRRDDGQMLKVGHMPHLC